MTLFSVILLIIITLIVGGFTCYIAYEFHYEDSHIACLVTIVVSLLLIFGMWFGTYLYLNNTEAGKRALKTQDSNFNNGIERVVKVYDVDGDLISEYRGTFDIDYSDERILFDDENGNRHVIYFKTGTIIVDEVN